MNEHPPDRLLRVALGGNALFSGLCGLTGVGASAWLADTLGGPSGAVVYIAQGVSLIGFGVFLLVLVTRREIRTGLALAVVVLDLLWVAGSAAPLLLSGTLTRAGTVTVSLLALVVLDFAALQYLGVRRVRRARGARGAGLGEAERTASAAP